MGSGRAPERLICMILAAQVPFGAAAWAECRPDAVDLRGPFGQARFTVEVADDGNERSRGLMFRESLPSAAGMLFLYPQPQRATFWMKDTLIPLDMIFVDGTGRVTRVHSRAVPKDLTLIDGGEGVVAVLEINGGLASRLGIAPGAELRHPGLPGAAWSCGE